VCAEIKYHPKIIGKGLTYGSLYKVENGSGPKVFVSGRLFTQLEYLPGGPEEKVGRTAHFPPPEVTLGSALLISLFSQNITGWPGGSDLYSF